jgi:hypothetical protein
MNLVRFFLICAAFQVTAVIAEDQPTAQPLKLSIAELAAKYSSNPDSCEALYYGLFYDQKTKKEVFILDPTENESILSGRATVTEASRKDLTFGEEVMLQHALEDVFSDIKSIYLKTILSNGANTEHQQIIQEWRNRIERIKLRFSDVGDGAFLSPYRRREIQINELENTCEPIKGAADNLGQNLVGEEIQPIRKMDLPPEILWGNGRRKNIRAAAANAFTMGHEAAHSLMWAPEKLIACLHSGASIGSSVGSRQFLRYMSPEIIRKIKDELLKPEHKEKISEEILQEQPHMQRGQGMGEEAVPRFEALLKQGKYEEAEAKLLMFETPNQMYEAVADHFGMKAAVSYVSNKYPGSSESAKAARKKAAIQILFSMAPEGYNDRASAILNKIGSKKLNEERVMRIILANKKFREMLGCEFARKPAPIECPDF